MFFSSGFHRMMQFRGSVPDRYTARGEMAEWSKARDSKSRNPQKGFEGSNPSLSASLRFCGSFSFTGLFLPCLRRRLSPVAPQCEGGRGALASDKKLRLASHIRTAARIIIKTATPPAALPSAPLVRSTEVRVFHKYLFPLSMQ